MGLYVYEVVTLESNLRNEEGSTPPRPHLRIGIKFPCVISLTDCYDVMIYRDKDCMFSRYLYILLSLGVLTSQDAIDVIRAVPRHGMVPGYATRCAHDIQTAPLLQAR